MPKVTVEHLEARKNQILEAARACFIRKGFHQTTMQDICQECGLSPGAIYRYFRSKADIIKAMSEQQLERALATINDALRRLGTLEVLDLLVDHFFPLLEGPEGEAHARASIEMWAESMRNEEMRQAGERQYRTIRDVLARIVRRGQTEGLFGPELDPGAVADVMIALFEGLHLAKALNRDAVNVRKYTEVVRAMCSGQFARAPEEVAPRVSVDAKRKGLRSHVGAVST